MSGFSTFIKKYAENQAVYVFALLLVDMIFFAAELGFLYIVAFGVVYLMQDPSGICNDALHYAALSMAVIYILTSFFTAWWRYYNNFAKSGINIKTEEQEQADTQAETDRV